MKYTIQYGEPFVILRVKEHEKLVHLANIGRNGDSYCRKFAEKAVESYLLECADTIQKVAFSGGGEVPDIMRRQAKHFSKIMWEDSGVIKSAKKKKK